MTARGRLFRRMVPALLALYPARFRRDFGRDVADTHLDRYRSERRHSPAASAVYVVTALADVCWGAAQEWKETGGDALRRRFSTAARTPEATMRFWRELQQDVRGPHGWTRRRACAMSEEATIAA